MSKQGKIRRLPRKRYPYGKFKYVIEFIADYRKNTYEDDLQICEQGRKLEDTLKRSAAGKFRFESNEDVYVRLFLTDYRDLFLVKLIAPALCQTIYEVELIRT